MNSHNVTRHNGGAQTGTQELENGGQNKMTLRSVPEVIRDIVQNIEAIAHAEFLLAKTQFKEDVSGAAAASKALLAGAVFAFYALGFALLSAVWGLSKVMSPWMAALAVAVGVGIIAGILVAVGTGKLREHAKSMERFIQKEEDKWASTRSSSNAKLKNAASHSTTTLTN